MPEIQIVVEAIEGNTAAIKNVQTQLTGIKTSTEQVNAQQRNLAQQFKMSWTEINSAVQIGIVAYRAVSQVISEVVNTYVDYTDKVRTISQVTGESAESVSRLLQVTDDYKISSESLTTVMKKMATEGFSFTTESLADLSDQYLKLNAGVDRQIFLNEKFGRQGADFAEIMLAGGKAIRDQSDAISKNLILTEKSLKETRQYEIAVDNLNDSLEGLKITLGNEIIPVFTFYATLLETIISKTEDASSATDLLGIFLGKLSEIGWGNMPVLGGLRKELEKLTAATEDAYDATSELNYVLDYSEDAFKKQAVAAIIAKAALDGIIDPQEEQYIYGMATALGVLTQQEIDAALKAFEFQNLMLSIMDMPAEIQKKFILNVELYGWEAAQAAMQGMGATPPTTYRPTTTGTNTTTTGTTRAVIMAGGGNFSGWAMVGDSMGGGMTPYTEWVYAPQGATVYNQSQMSGKSAPPMNSGGMIPPISNDINLSDKSIRDLADALSYKLAQVQ